MLLKLTLPIILIATLIAGCGNHQTTEYPTNLNKLINHISDTLVCSELVVNSINNTHPSNSYHIIFKNSKYSSKIHISPNYFHDFAYKHILSGIHSMEQLPDSLLIEFNEGFFCNDVGQSRIHRRLYQPQEIVETYTLINSPSYVLINLGENLLNKSAYKAIDSLCDVFSEAKKVQHLVYQLKGLSLAKKKDTVRAIQAFQNALSIDSNYAECHGALGLIFYANPNYGEASFHILKMIEIDSLDPRPYYYQARILYKNNPRKACQLYQKSKSLGLEVSTDLTLLGCDL